MLKRLLLDNNFNKIVNKCVPMLYDAADNVFYKVEVPALTLEGLNFKTIKYVDDTIEIPSGGGNYWILTNEPVRHCFNSGKSYPAQFNHAGVFYNIVYNGVSSTLKSRVKEHLLRSDMSGQSGSHSGISVDIQMQPCGKEPSHVKYLLHENQQKKLPKFLNVTQHTRLSKAEILNMAAFTCQENQYISNNTNIHFKNGINVQDTKHTPYNWIFAWCEIDNHNIRDYIETEWRLQHGVPILCSYTSGR